MITRDNSLRLYCSNGPSRITMGVVDACARGDAVRLPARQGQEVCGSSYVTVGKTASLRRQDLGTGTGTKSSWKNVLQSDS
jgi:hypothetical protein